MSEVNAISVAASIPMWLEVLRASAPIIAACAAGLVAWRFGIVQTRIAHRQSETASDKLKLDLYEKRIAVYQSASAFISYALTMGDMTQDKEMEFLRGTASAEWLFGDDVKKYLDQELWVLCVDFHAINHELKDRQTSLSSKEAAEKRSKIFSLLRKQPQRLSEVFKPYLRFER